MGVSDCVATGEELTVATAVVDADTPGASERVGVIDGDTAADAPRVRLAVAVAVALAAALADTVANALLLDDAP